MRRILPALIVVLAATSVAGYLLLFPDKLEAYGVSLASALFSLSNFYFWSNSGYLEGIGTSNLLLHTWSLSVEEQFYLALPLILYLANRFCPKRMTMVVAAVAAASFVAAVITLRSDTGAAFYLPHVRAWELLLGVLVALGALPELKNPWLRNAAALAGLGLMLGSAMLFTRATPFPGFAALAPCLGCAMVIWTGSGDTLVRRALSLKPIVFVGLISYSLYLWHWPLIVLREEFVAANPALTSGSRAFIFALTFILAVLTWRFVERPFRTRTIRQRYVFAGAGAAAALLVVVGAAMTVTAGAPSRFSPEIVRLASYLEYNTNMRTGREPGVPSCQIGTRDRFQDYDRARCLGSSKPGPSILLIGDSYASHLRPGLDKVFPNASILQATAIGCKPALGKVEGDPDCASLARFIFTDYLPRQRVDMVLISGMWSEQEFSKLGEVLRWGRARGIPMVVVGRGPEYDAPLPAILARSLERGEPGLARRHAEALPALLDPKLKQFVIAEGGIYASPYTALCLGGVCQTMTDRTPMQFDQGHFTREGSAEVVKRLRLQGAFKPIEAKLSRDGEDRLAASRTSSDLRLGV